MATVSSIGCVTEIVLYRGMRLFYESRDNYKMQRIFKEGSMCIIIVVVNNSNESGAVLHTLSLINCIIIMYKSLSSKDKKKVEFIKL